MVSQIVPRAWAKAIAHPAVEFGPIALEVLAGQVPPGLQGTLYRNGPGRLTRGGQRVGHWFDGDGGILAVQCVAGQSTGCYRYVQTAGYREEEQCDRYLYGGYGTRPTSWNPRHRGVKHVANTSVLPLADKLLALWEGGVPYALDRETLATVGLDELGGLGGDTYSAHPQRDGQTGEIFNFGIGMGVPPQLHLYRSDAAGRLRQRGAIALTGVPVLHDFVMAGPYLIFCIPPVRLAWRDLGKILLGTTSFSEAMQWRPALGTEIVVCDRDTLQLVTRFTTDPWFQWHFGNGAVLADGSVEISLVQYADWQTNQFLREVATGTIHTQALGQFWRLRLDPQAGKVLERSPLIAQSCEFPVVAPLDVGQAARYSYLNMQRPENDFRELFGAIARFDHHTGQVDRADCGAHTYPSEPIYAPDVQNPNRGWILSVVYDGVTEQSQVWVWRSDGLAAGPVCQLALPHVIPHSFHGAWQPACASM